MQRQLGLFGAKARATDPATSFEAADGVEASGAANDQRRRCYEAVLAEPGLTAAEVARHTGLERHAPSRRLPELRDEGLVYNGEARMCTAMGRMSLTWWPVDIEHDTNP